MKKLSVFALVAALLTAACGTIEYSDANVIDPTRTLYVTLETPPGADGPDDPDFNTSCSNPGASADDDYEVTEFLTTVMQGAYVEPEPFGVVHLCAGTYETDDVIEFSNLGSITIEGDGMNETIISGAGGDDHALLAMVPVECLPEDEPCPSYFNVLTLKDLTLSDGVGGAVAFTLPDGDSGVIPFSAGGAVTAPLVATERVRFSNNSALCGGAVALYGWTLLGTDALLETMGDDELVAAEYYSNLVSTNSSQIINTEFTENTAAIGGAIAGVALDAGLGLGGPEEIFSCVNSGPLNIVNSTFEGNTAGLNEYSELAVGGGAIATANIIALEFALVGPEGLPEDVLAILNRDAWLQISGGTFSENRSLNAGGAVLSYGKTLISRATFTSNGVGAGLEMDGMGGAIAVAGELSLSYSTFVGNSASSGGAVLVFDLFGGSHVLTRNTFIRNVATDQGGAISGWTVAGSARGNRFTSNRAPVGSAVAVLTEVCSRTWSRRAARDWRGNTFRSNRGGRLPVECYVAAPAPS